MSLQLVFIPQLSSQAQRSAGVYLSGVLYACAFFLMLDAALWSAHRNPSDLHVTFAAWLPLLFSSLGMYVVNIVSKEHLRGVAAFGHEYGGAADASRARFVLFIGLAFMSGGLAMSFVYFVLNFVVHRYGRPVIYIGIESVLSSTCVMLSCVVLWSSQNLEDDYSYSLQL